MTAPILMLAPILLAQATGPASVPISPVGMPFYPEIPGPVGPEHPFYHTMRVSPIDDTSARADKDYRRWGQQIVDRGEVEAALRSTLLHLNLLAIDDNKARYRLVPTLEHLKVKIRFPPESEVTTDFTYSLEEVSTNSKIVEHKITSSALTSDGNVLDATLGVGRISLMTSVASIVFCLDEDAKGRKPSTCTLTPRFHYTPAPLNMPIILFH